MKLLRRDREYRADSDVTELPVVSVKTRHWRAATGQLWHIPSRATIYLWGGKFNHMGMTWYCGNQTCRPIPRKQECESSCYKECDICEAKCHEV